MPAGSLFGALSSSFLADRLSRKTAVQIAALIWIVGAILQAASNGVALLCSAIVPVYQAEIAPKEIRGRVVSLQQWAIVSSPLIQLLLKYTD
jgi:MFS family permease